MMFPRSNGENVSIPEWLKFFVATSFEVQQQGSEFSQTDLEGQMDRHLTEITSLNGL